MSFAATPLGQGSRRLDHSTFLGKNSTNPNPPSPRLIPTSYAFGASIPKSPATSPARERTTIAEENDSALARFARIKQREHSHTNVTNRPGGPKIISSPPHPEKWSVKDTTVQIATAFHQAATTDMPPTTTPNAAWASGATRPNAVPRSTSVEYEAQLQTTSRRLAAPPSRGSTTTGTRGKPLSKNNSLQQVPDSEGEEDLAPAQNGRGKSPFNALVNAGSKVLSTATYYARAGSREPENRAANTSNGNDSSYEQTEREFQAIRKAATATHKRNRMSTDNKAYKPSMSDLEESDEDFEEDGKTRRKKKKKKEAIGGPLNTLPVLSQDKRRKKRKSDGKGNLQSDNEGETDDSHSVHQHRASVARSANHDADISNETVQDLPSMDMDQGTEARAPTSSREGLGAAMGSVVFHLARSGFKSVSWVFTSALYIFGRLFGTMFDLVLLRPKQIISGSSGPYILIFLMVIVAFYFRDPLISNLPPISSSPYRGPEVPAANLADFNTRLLRLESALSTLSSDADKIKSRIENESKNQADVAGRVGSMETRFQKLQKENTKADGEAQKANKDLQNVKVEVEQLHAQLSAMQQQNHGKTDAVGSDEEARAKLKALEERVGSMEGSMREALEMAKSSTKDSAAGAAWWNKVVSGKKAVTIKSSDGQDVTGLIVRLVDSAISTRSGEHLGPDFALYSAGARAIPSLTSPTYEIRPSGLRDQLVGLVTGGSNEMIGRPPVTALHHELQDGHCWPFAGTHGQLGIALPVPVYISHFTVDHVPKAIALDIRSAPRQMEVWGLVEGKDNLATVKAWMKEKAARRAEALERGESVEVEEYPKTLPKSPQYIRIAAFSYNVHAADRTQTFPILPDVKELAIDFGIIVVRVLGNWGRNEFTCLYRVRVHGERMGGTPLPLADEST